MQSAPLPLDEVDRIERLNRYRILDTPPEESFDRITRIAAEMMGVPIVLVSLVDRERQWFKSRYGLEAEETSRDVAFCAHAILEDGLFIVEDASQDIRFFDNPLVTGDPSIRFYAGAPLKTSDGFSIGTLCAIDRRPRTLTERQRGLLADLSRIVVDALELRSQLRKSTNEAELARSLAEERKTSESRLHGQQAFLRSITDNLPVSIAYMDSEKKFRFVNRTAEVWYARPSSEILGRTLKDLGSDGDLSGTPPPRGEETNREELVSFPDGSKRWVDVTSIPDIDEQGTVRGYFKLAVDITERKRQEAEILSVNKELNSFAHSVAHDLRSPLRAIDGFGRALEEEYGDAVAGAGGEYLKRIRVAADRMGKLIDGLLDLSRVTRSKIEVASIDLSKIAEEISGELRDIDPARRVSFDIAPGMRCRADERLLRVVLENLMSNAWKFTAKTKDAKIEFGAVMTDRDEQAFFVRDNGAGFDMAYADKLFMPFQRLHTVREFEGTGIGLATVERVVQRFGGRIWAKAEAGKGAAFFFTIAVGSVPARLNAGDITSTRSHEPPPKGTETILLVDDSRAMSAIAKRQLTSLGYRVEVAENGREALTLLESGARFDLLFSDIVMPGGVDGLELAADVSRRWPDIKILMTTGFQGGSAGNDEIKWPILAKPYRIKDLAGAVRKALDENVRPS